MLGSQGSLSAAPAALTPGSLSPSPRSPGPGAGPGAGEERSRRGRARGRPQPGVCTPSRARGRAQQRLCPRPAEPRQKALSCSAWQRAGLPRAARLGNGATAKGSPPAPLPACCGVLGAPGPSPPKSRRCPHRQGWRSHCGLRKVPGRELFLLPRPRSAKRPLLPVRWQLRPPAWLQAPSVLGVLAGRTQKGFLQRRTPQWLLSFIASAREIHVYCNFFFFCTCASQIARINS